MAQRFYQLYYQDTGKPIFFEDMGNLAKISGLVLQGMGSTIIVLSPNAHEVDTTEWVIPSLEDWQRIIHQTDDPIYFDETSDLPIKPVHRKQRMAISGAVQQKVWVRDNFACVACGKKMGEAPMTVDHFTPLELGGENNHLNYITMCRKCNKRKGSRDPHEWCSESGLSYMKIIMHMRETPLP